MSETSATALAADDPLQEGERRPVSSEPILEAQAAGELFELARRIETLSARLVEQIKPFGRGDLARDLVTIQLNGAGMAETLRHLQPEAERKPFTGEPDVVRSRLRHDLRNRLTPVLGCCELWLDESDDSALRPLLSDLQRILEAGRQSLALIERHLAGSLTGSCRESNVRRLVAQALEKHSKEDARSALRGHILVADDHEANRTHLVARLTAEGHTVATAANGIEALAALGSDKFDVLLLDMLMPEMHGFEVLARMKAAAELRDISVIMISGLNDVDVVAPCIERGAEDYLPKPFNQVLLRARINACLEKKRLRDREASHLLQIERERQRADDLLNVILPHEIAEELKSTDTVKPRRHEEVAILFADIVGFTPYSDARPPEEVIHHLQEAVEAWEQIAAIHEVEKIKTIGDAFMAASGLLRPAENPVLNCLHCGLQMIDATRRVAGGWELRVGIHVGSVVAGKLGGRQFSFDLWGDTVNTAARMESHGRPGVITLSKPAWARVASSCASLGEAVVQEITVKGKGVMEVVRFQGHGKPGGC
jgi:class 3 adenylate cyclase